MAHIDFSYNLEIYFMTNKWRIIECQFLHTLGRWSKKILQAHTQTTNEQITPEINGTSVSTDQY